MGGPAGGGVGVLGAAHLIQIGAVGLTPEPSRRCQSTWQVQDAQITATEGAMRLVRGWNLASNESR